MDFYKILVLICFLLVHTVSSSDCEICDLKEKLYETESELSQCKLKLNDNSYLGQVCSRVGSWFTKDMSMKIFVKDLLDKLDISDIRDVEKDLVIKLSVEDVKVLKKFVTEEEGKAEHVDNVLKNAFTVRETIMDKTTDFFSSTITETSMHFKANYVIIFQILVLLCCVVLPLALGAPKLPVFLFMCLYAVFTTWVKLYYVAAAKKQATLAKHSNVPNMCRIEQQGWMAAVGDFVTGMFNGKHDPCEDYYTAAMVDPALEVGLVTAVMETLSSCILIPAQTLGTALGSYYCNLLLPLPLVWKIPVMILATVIVLFLLLLGCGYEFSIPFLLRIGPDRNRKRKNSDDHNQDMIADTNNRTVNGIGHGGSAGWSDLIYERHPSEEFDMTDNTKTGALPYPTNRNVIDRIVDST